MNAPVPATAPRPQIMAGGQVAALVPQTLDEAFRVATAMAASGMTPKGVDKPEQVLVALMAGAELGFAPFQAMQSFAIINGKPNIWGDAIPALLWSRGFKLKEWFDDEDQPTKAFCRITRPEGEEIERTFSIEDARKASLLGKQGPWQQYQKRMLQMRARAFAARDGAADVLRGMHIAEEVQDYQPITARAVPAEKPNLAARLAAPADGPREGFNAVHADLGDDPIPDFDATTPPASEQPASDGTPQPLTDAGDQFPGDAPSSGEKTAAPVASEGAGAVVDPINEKERAADWHSGVSAALPSMSEDEIAAFLANPDEQASFARLEAHQPQLALDLNKAITARRRELKQ